MKRNKNLTEEYILEAFAKLLSKKDYNKITVCDICQKAGVSRMSFYRNFKDKDDLLKRGLSILIELTEERINKLGVANQYTISKEFFETFKSIKDLLPHINDADIVKKLIIESIMKVEKDINSVDYMSKTSKYTPIFLMSGLMVVLFEWLRNGAVESTEEMARFVVSVTSSNSFDFMPLKSLENENKIDFEKINNRLGLNFIKGNSVTNDESKANYSVKLNKNTASI